jgi:gamma-glutamyltranspeptidase / glutathione hydrolase
MQSKCFTSVTNRFAIVLSVLIATVSSPAAVTAADPDWVVHGAFGMVATDSEIASTVGRRIIADGGNAIDAAVAVSFALAVVRPYSTGLGGGGFLMARLGDKKYVVQDFRETAPAASTRDMFASTAQSTGARHSEIGALAVAIPGMVAGRAEALAKWGTMSLEAVVAPAVRLAREGFPVDSDYVRATKSVAKKFEKHPELKTSCSYVWKTHLNEGKFHAVGDTLKQPALANLIEKIGKEGPDAFYKGEVAAAIAKTMKDHGGIITERDLARYKTKQRKPIKLSFRGHDLLLMPPPSSGGVAIAQMLSMFSMLPKHRDVDEDRAMHYRIELMKHAFADRARYLGDTDFANVPVRKLLSSKHAIMNVSKTRPDKTRSPEQYGTHGLVSDSGTSHFSIVDRESKAVVSTETINTTFGSLVAVEEWGLILNNEMNDFTIHPGKPNIYGLIQSEANAIAPGKRPLSSMSPTIAIKNSKPVLMIGASGGPRIITAVFNVILGVLEDGLSLPDAVARIRPHHQWQPNEVYFDKDPSASTVAALKKRGHVVSEKRKGAAVQAIGWDGSQWVGVSDPRKGGKPSGF